MPVSNGYNPVYLFYKEQGLLILSYGISETHIPEKSWAPSIHETKTKIIDFIENPYRYGDSYVHKHYEPKIEGDQVCFYRDDKKISEEQKNYVNKPKIFIQINLGHEEQKSGINSNDLKDFYMLGRLLSMN